jgi:tetratricopeptide (TPR) repeat protein
MNEPTMRTRRYISVLLLVLSLPVLLGFSLPGGLQRVWRQADRAFRKQQYEQAQQLYDQARRQQPEEWRLVFNTATAQAAAKKYEQAAADFEKIAQSGPQELRQAAEYNAGNCYLANQQADKAVEHYKRALYLKPDDINAKWNLELAKRRQKQQQQQQQQQRKQQKKEDQQKQKQRQQPQDQKMDKEQARRLLQSLSQADRELQKRMAREQKQRRAGEARPAIDW